jgi:hypothetical protein
MNIDYTLFNNTLFNNTQLSDAIGTHCLGISVHGVYAVRPRCRAAFFCPFSGSVRLSQAAPN